jgi:hypothetical protein
MAENGSPPHLSGDDKIEFPEINLQFNTTTDLSRGWRIRK